MTLEPQAIAAYDASRKISHQPFRSACYAPYTSLYFNTNGDVIACCKNLTYVLGNVAEQRLDEIWRGKKAQAMRKALANYKLGVGCEFCEWQIKGGAHDQVYATMFDELPASEDAEWPARMEFTVSNTCNLACVMCYGVLSSTIRAHREKLPPLPKVYDDRFFEDLRRYLPHLRDAKFFGGEPFLAQENYRIWDMMIEDGITIPCHVTTNGTQWGKKVERILEALPCSISVSIDGTTKATVESVRVNANFEEVRQNADRFLAYTRQRRTYFTFTYCLMRQNWFEFGDYLKYADERRVQVFINTVIDPPNCSLYTLPPAELAAIVKQMEEMDAREGYSKLRKNGNVWTSGVEALRKNADERQRQGVSDVKRTMTSRDPIAQAWVAVGAGKYDEALAEVAGIDSESSQYYSRLCLEGHVLRLQKRVAEAAVRLDEAISLSPKSPHAYVERAWLNLGSGNHAAGFADAEKGVAACGSKRHDMACYAYAVLAQGHALLGHRDEARQAMDEAVALMPNNPDLHVQRGWMFFQGKLFAEAAEACARALELAPQHSVALHLRDVLNTTSPTSGSD